MAATKRGALSTAPLIEREQGAEMARLLAQHRLLTRAAGGLFPQLPELTGVESVLDLACGPGAWALDVAFAWPGVQVTGIDLSPSMVQHARASARTQGLEQNTTFRVMDITEPLAFEDHTFDVINGSFLVGLLHAACWPTLLAECQRVLKPGGSVRVTEGEYVVSSSQALQQLHGSLFEVLRRQGRTCSVDGHSQGMAPLLGRWLREAGFEHIELRPFVLDASCSSEISYAWCKQCEITFLLLKPSLTASGVLGEAEFDALYQQMMIDLLGDDFACLSFGLTLCGVKACWAQ